jgi:hypothetical protein
VIGLSLVVTHSNLLSSLFQFKKLVIVLLGNVIG